MRRFALSLALVCATVMSAQAQNLPDPIPTMQVVNVHQIQAAQENRILLYTGWVTYPLPAGGAVPVPPPPPPTPIGLWSYDTYSPKNFKAKLYLEGVAIPPVTPQLLQTFVTDPITSAVYGRDSQTGVKLLTSIPSAPMLHSKLFDLTDTQVSDDRIIAVHAPGNMFAIGDRAYLRTGAGEAERYDIGVAFENTTQVEKRAKLFLEKGSWDDHVVGEVTIPARSTGVNAIRDKVFDQFYKHAGNKYKLRIEFEGQIRRFWIAGAPAS